MRVWTVTGVLAGLIVCGASVAGATNVCTYTVRPNAIGFACPFNGIETACVTQTTGTGPCDTTLRCIGGSGFVCDLTLSPSKGPRPQCPLGSHRLGGVRCIAQRALVSPTAAPTASPSPTVTAVPPPAPATKSGPIALTRDGATLVAVNTDVDTVTLFDVGTDG
ncbi:MAG TPA: hypothetical protein VL049_26390, partial [Candidatus Dormibacteraeota bacterium]|nr:hypothetical protein [Candidatus Dormibacteraeota bacterium]